MNWIVAIKPEQVHELLLQSDLATATPTAPAPTRSYETTSERVRDGCVHALVHGETMLAAFTLTEIPPFNLPGDVFEPRSRPAYLSRLCIRDPAPVDASLLGARCLRHAVALAQSRGCDALRSEANPDLVRSITLLEMFGMRPKGGILTDTEGRRRVYLERLLNGGAI